MLTFGVKVSRIGGLKYYPRMMFSADSLNFSGNSSSRMANPIIITLQGRLVTIVGRWRYGFWPVQVCEGGSWWWTRAIRARSSTSSRRLPQSGTTLLTNRAFIQWTPFLPAHSSIYISSLLLDPLSYVFALHSSPLLSRIHIHFDKFCVAINISGKGYTKIGQL